MFYRGGPNDGVIAGTYEERVTPQIDSTLGLVGSTGKAVFRFLKRNGGALSSENIVTVQRSKVVGEVPEGGDLLVESSVGLRPERASLSALREGWRRALAFALREGFN